MMYEEFNRISGATADINMYYKEIEPTYMFFGYMDKKVLSDMYWGARRGGYNLWIRANNLYKASLVVKKHGYLMLPSMIDAFNEEMKAFKTDYEKFARQ